MKKLFVLAVIVCLAGACVPPPVATTPEEIDYLAKVEAQPLTFRIPAAQSNDAWGRIQSWIGRFSIYMKIKTVSDYVIETERPGFWTAYSASRAPMGEQVEFTVRCWQNNHSVFDAQDYAKRNAQILAYYAVTGEVMEKFIKK